MKIAIILFAILLLLPLYWMLKGSFEEIRGMMRVPPLPIPKRLTTINYERLFEGTQIPRWFFNSIVIASLTIALSLFCLTTAAYAFSMYEFIGKRIVYWMFIISIMLPAQALLISKFVLMRRLSLIGSWWSLILVGGANPVGIIIMKNYFNKIPKAMADSGRIDGANELRILAQIYLPQCKPILGYMCIVGLIGHFQIFLWPLLMITDKNKWPLSLGVIKTIKEYFRVGGTNQTAEGLLGIQLAAGIVLFVPVILIFAIFQRNFRQQFLAGGIKE